MSLVYFGVTAKIAAVLADVATDSDYNPTLGSFSADVTFTPLIRSGDVVRVFDASPPTMYVPVPITASVDSSDGLLKLRTTADSGGAGTYAPLRLLGNSASLDLEGDGTLYYAFSFKNIRIDSRPSTVVINGGSFEAPDHDTTIDLIDYIGATGSTAVGVTRIAPGDVRLEGGNIQFSFAGQDIPGAIPFTPEFTSTEITDSTAIGRTLLTSATADTVRATLDIARKSFQPINVLDFGAVGDGVADDTAAIQAAIDSAPEAAGVRETSEGTNLDTRGGATILIPAGVYKISGPVLVPPRVSILAHGATFVAAHSSACVKVIQDPVEGLFQGVGPTISGLTVDGAEVAVNGFWLQSTFLAGLELCAVTGTTGDGFRMDGSQYSVLDRCSAIDCAGWGLAINRNNQSAEPDGNNNTFTRFLAQSCGLGGVKISYGIENAFVGLTSQFHRSGHGILFNGPGVIANAVFSAHFEENEVDVEFVTPAASNQLYSPVFWVGAETVRHVINDGFYNTVSNPILGRDSGPQVRRAGTTACYELGPNGGRFVVDNPRRITGTGNFSADGSKMFVKEDGTEFDPLKKNLGGAYLAVRENEDARTNGETRFSKLGLTGLWHGDEMLGVRQNTDTDDRLIITANGKVTWADGAGVEDASIARSGAAKLAVTGAVDVTGVVTCTAGTATGSAATIDGTQTLTNKSISGATNTFSAIPQSAVTDLATDLSGKQAASANLTAFAAKTAPTGDVVGTSDTQTLTGKTISGATNTLSSIPQSAVTDLATDLSGKQAASANLTAFAAKTAPTGDVVGTSDTQFLTNKQLQGVTYISGTDAGLCLYRAADAGYLATAFSSARWSNQAVTDDVILRADIKSLLLSVVNNTGAIKFTTGSSDTEKMRIGNDGKVGVGTASPSTLLDVNGTFRIASGNAPAHNNSTGTAGTIAWDTSYLYVCTATDTWKRIALAADTW